MENLNLPPFYPGQKVICVVSDEWFDVDSNKELPGPKKNDTVTVHKCIIDKGEWILILKEYDPESIDGYLYEENGTVYFKPVQQQSFPLMTFTKRKERGIDR